MKKFRKLLIILSLNLYVLKSVISNFIRAFKLNEAFFLKKNKKDQTKEIFKTNA